MLVKVPTSTIIPACRFILFVQSFHLCVYSGLYIEIIFCVKWKNSSYLGRAHQFEIIINFIFEASLTPCFLENRTSICFRLYGSVSSFWLLLSKIMPTVFSAFHSQAFCQCVFSRKLINSNLRSQVTKQHNGRKIRKKISFSAKENHCDCELYLPM